MKLKHLFLSICCFAMMASCCEPEIIGNVNSNLYPQETNNWCWAAVTQMLAQQDGNSVTQCELANHRFSKNNCCNLKDDNSTCRKTDDCNNPGWLELDYAGLKFDASNDALSWSSLKSQVYCRKKLMGYAYGTPGVVGHVVVVKGYVTVAGTDYVVLNDPWAPCIGSERLITYNQYADPTGTATHWTTWYNIAPK